MATDSALRLELNRLGASDVKARLQALEYLTQGLSSGAVAIANLLQADAIPAILRLLYDTREKCREKSVLFLSEFVKRIDEPTLTTLLPLIVPTVATRVATEPTDEIRLAISRFFVSIIGLSGIKLLPYFDDIRKIISSLLADSFQDVRIEGCRTLAMLAETLRDRTALHSGDFLKSLAPNLSSRYTAVRIAALQSLQSLVMHSGGASGRDLAFFSGGPGGPASPFEEYILSAPPGQLLLVLAEDRTARVKEALFDLARAWLQTAMSECSNAATNDVLTTFMGWLLPPLLLSLSDSIASVQDAAFQTLESLGGVFSNTFRESMDEAMGSGATDAGEDDVSSYSLSVPAIGAVQLPPKPPGVGARAMVATYLRPLIELAFAELSEWTADRRKRGAVLLWTTLWYARNAVSQFLPRILDELFRVVEDVLPEYGHAPSTSKTPSLVFVNYTARAAKGATTSGAESVKALCGACAVNCGRFVRGVDYCISLCITTALGKSAVPRGAPIPAGTTTAAPTTRRRLAALEVLDNVITGVTANRLAPHLSALVDGLTDNEWMVAVPVGEPDAGVLYGVLLHVLATAIDKVGSVDATAVQSIAQKAFTMALHIASARILPNATLAAERLIDRLAGSLKQDVAGLFGTFFDTQVSDILTALSTVHTPMATTEISGAAIQAQVVHLLNKLDMLIRNTRIDIVLGRLVDTRRPPMLFAAIVDLTNRAAGRPPEVRELVLNSVAHILFAMRGISDELAVQMASLFDILYSEVIGTNLKWARGMQEALVRKAAAGALRNFTALAEESLNQTIRSTAVSVMSTKQERIKVLLDTLEEDDTYIRLAGVAAITHWLRFNAYPNRVIPEDALPTVGTALLKRLDDHSDDVRIAVGPAIAAFFGCFPPQSAVQDIHVTLVKTLFVHLRDHDTSVRDAIYNAILAGPVKVQPQVVLEQAMAAEGKQMESELYTRLKEAATSALSSMDTQS